jgi:sigma-54 dependent transcriptional regulator, flagellar regulatory protein
MEQDISATRLMGPTGNSASIRSLRRLIEQVAGHETNVLITGESGTGKEVAARALHDKSLRHDKPFVAVNCGAIPAELLESELFGHEKGAFTGAITARKGRFEIADGGTLFLDEIGDMSLPMQVKILRVLQERTYERVGSSRSVHCDVRIVAATHRNLEASIAAGSFREDLFYRLNVFPLEMPPLRERLDDLPLLVESISESMRHSGRGSMQFAPETLHALRSYGWPGNVRELANLIERLAVLHPNATVKIADLPQRYRQHVVLPVAAPVEALAAPAATPTELSPKALSVEAASTSPAAAEAAVAGPAIMDASLLPADGVNLKDRIEAIELALIRQALDQAGGVVAHAARLLSTHRTTLVEKLRKYGLHREDLREEQRAS